MQNPVKVGTYTLTQSKVYTTFYECAAWYQKVRVEPGTYEVFAYPTPWENNLGHSLYIEAEGEIVDATFQALFGGMPIRGSKDEGPDKVGQRERASSTIATYAIHEALLSGSLKLDPNLVYALRCPSHDDPNRIYTFYWYRGTRPLPEDALTLEQAIAAPRGDSKS